jgi:hypothetical protein
MTLRCERLGVRDKQFNLDNAVGRLLSVTTASVHQHTTVHAGKASADVSKFTLNLFITFETAPLRRATYDQQGCETPPTEVGGF